MSKKNGTHGIIAWCNKSQLVEKKEEVRKQKMSHTDSISDMLTRIRNAVHATHESVEIPLSKLKIQIAEVLKKEGYISSYELFESDPVKKNIKVFYEAIKKEKLEIRRTRGMIMALQVDRRKQREIQIKLKRGIR